jgi:hypothetical protein
LPAAFLFAGPPRTFEEAAARCGCPVEVAAEIRPDEKVLNPYDWGGYLAWRGIAVFVDGRADLYAWGSDVLRDAMEMPARLEFEEMAGKYEVWGRGDSLPGAVARGPLAGAVPRLGGGGEEGWGRAVQADDCKKHNLGRSVWHNAKG